jgi:hypothetical protein
MKSTHEKEQQRMSSGIRRECGKEKMTGYQKDDDEWMGQGEEGVVEEGWEQGV